MLQSTACREDFAGDRLFEVAYPVVNVGVPAGQVNFSTFVAAQPRLATNITTAARDAGVDLAEIDNISGLRARVTSLNGEDFREFSRIELRACPVGRPRGCDQTLFILFSTDDLFGRRDQVVNLNPQLLNLRDLFLGNDDVRVELIFTPGPRTTSRTIEARLEWSVQAVGNL